ncbi:MAG: carboxylating nicotinate-nucleotide diphosphorylase [Candidatus Zixiibacteriota bacterium]|nr:MAG: carboxylating nicotinate-nucleotide diphosphorylase [candidate division Zixibacteria bacterium]
MDKQLSAFIDNALREDIGAGDFSSLACVPAEAQGKAKLLVKEDGIIAGIRIARAIFEKVDDEVKFIRLLDDGSGVKNGDIAFTVSGRSQSILKAERLLLNVMQRMSGIATETARYVKKIEGAGAKILDTRKTTPGVRFLEKEAVKLGGGVNHRMGLYDMIMLKDNHIDFAGGIEQAILKTNRFLKENNLPLKIEIECRNFDELHQVITIGKVDRIMLDNFTPEETRKAVALINGEYETESSGGIVYDNIREYAECGVDFISVGALTHQIRSLDMSLKATN